MMQDEEASTDMPRCATTVAPAVPTELRAAEAGKSGVAIFGVRIVNVNESDAVALVEQAIREGDGQTRAIYFVNAHTLNLAAERSSYRTLLNFGHAVFGDGTGVRWAARRRGIAMRANLNGTDLVPRLFEETAGRGYRYYLLGATPDTIERAAASARERFGGWTLAGFHHGYIDRHDCTEVIRQINDARPHVLLVGMGNPLQEQWIDRHLDALRVPVCMGTGGLFDHWAGNLRRAPRWVRGLGYEWLQLLLQQPHKWRRYLLGNPRFLWRMVKYRRSDLALMAEAAGKVEWVSATEATIAWQPREPGCTN